MRIYNNRHTNNKGFAYFTLGLAQKHLFHNISSFAGINMTNINENNLKHAKQISLQM